jgi:hypothetical protein
MALVVEGWGIGFTVTSNCPVLAPAVSSTEVQGVEFRVVGYRI